MKSDLFFCWSPRRSGARPIPQLDISIWTVLFNSSYYQVKNQIFGISNPNDNALAVFGEISHFSGQFPHFRNTFSERLSVAKRGTTGVVPSWNGNWETVYWKSKTVPTVLELFLRNWYKVNFIYHLNFRFYLPWQFTTANSHGQKLVHFRIFSFLSNWTQDYLFMRNRVDPCAIQFTFQNCNYRKLEGTRRNQNLSKLTIS